MQIIYDSGLIMTKYHKNSKIPNQNKIFEV